MCARLRTGLLIVSTFLWILAQSAQDAHGKGPKGKGGGRGGGKSYASSGGGKHGGGSYSRSVKGASSHAGSTKHSGYSGGGKGRASHQSTSGSRLSTGESGSGGSRPWSMQRAKEEQKLNHRLAVADKLEGIAERNENTNLQDTAERKRQKAQQLYKKRMAKIDGKDDSPEVDDDLENLLEPPAGPADRVSGVGDPDTPGPDDPIAPSEKLTGRENALYRQLRNEQRKLAKQMEAAELLWDAYEQTEDEQLADVARAFEERVLAQYQKRMDAIRDFQQRHGLPDMISEGAW